MSTLKLPQPFASIPKENFLFGASPIQYLPRITKALGGKVGVYAKREDCNSGLAFGGNKVRKLECAVQAPHLDEYSNILQQVFWLCGCGSRRRYTCQHRRRSI
jgi:hypothetical protein